MARMTAAQAAVEILKAEGVTHLFGLPGAAINPFYSAMLPAPLPPSATSLSIGPWVRL